MILHQLEEILSAGIQAPSADNLQPWRFVIYKQNFAGGTQEVDRVELHLAPERAQDFAASGLLTLYLSAGAVIENIRVAGFRRGVKLDVQYLPLQGDSCCVAFLYFSQMPPEKHVHDDAVFKRVTNRKFYRVSRSVDPKVYGDLAHLAAEQGMRITRLKRGEERYKKLEQILAKADQLRYEVERLHREFFKTVRFDALKAEDGLPVATFESGPGSSLLFRFIRSWARMRFSNALGFSRMMGRYTALQMRSSDAAVLLTGPSSLPAQFIRGGEMMERIWHELTIQGLSVQPMEALPIFILNMQQGRMSDFKSDQLELLAQLKREFYEVFNLSEASAVMMLWRVGYAPDVSARTKRRPLSSFVIER